MSEMEVWCLGVGVIVGLFLWDFIKSGLRCLFPKKPKIKDFHDYCLADINAADDFLNRITVIDEKMQEFHANSNDLSKGDFFAAGNEMHNWAIDNGYTDAEIIESSQRVIASRLGEL